MSEQQGEEERTREAQSTEERKNGRKCSQRRRAVDGQTSQEESCSCSLNSSFQISSQEGQQNRLSNWYCLSISQKNKIVVKAWVKDSVLNPAGSLLPSVTWLWIFCTHLCPKAPVHALLSARDLSHWPWQLQLQTLCYVWLVLIMFVPGPSQALDQACLVTRICSECELCALDWSL